MIAGISSEIFMILLVLVASVTVLAITLYKNKKSVAELHLALINAENALLKKQSRAYQLGGNSELGNIHQILGEFKNPDLRSPSIITVILS